MEQLINFCLKKLDIHSYGDLLRRWVTFLDWFFYFNKITGCGIPTVEIVRRYL